MNWVARLRLLAGVVGAIALALVLTVVFNQRQSQAASSSARITSDVFTVGADHAGTVTRQWVRDGDRVAQGDPLFAVQSLQLQQDIENGLEVGDTDAYTVAEKTGTITYRAAVSGVVDQVTAQAGNSVPGSSPLARITTTGDRKVLAEFRLTPRDYGRVHVGAPVRLVLPDESVIDGSVVSIAVSTDGDGQATTALVVDAPALAGAAEALTLPGTPIRATVQLDDDGPLAGVSDLTTDFLRKIGFW